MSEVRIVFIHLYLGDHRHRLFVTAATETVVECLLDQVADAALGIRHTVREWRERQALLLMRNLCTAQIQPHLRAVTVGEHDVIVRTEHCQYRLCHLLHGGFLMSD
ncbi:hypothetical protein D3C86_1582730 [compost metagenome]